MYRFAPSGSLNTHQSSDLANRVNRHNHSLRKIFDRWRKQGVGSFSSYRQMLTALIGLGIWGTYTTGASATRTVVEMLSGPDRPANSSS